MNKKVIIISGTPGVGKSTLAKALAKKVGYGRLNLHRYYQTISSGYNKNKQTYNINPKKFIGFVQRKQKLFKTGLIIDSHISHYLPAHMVDLCIVVTCSDLKKLRHRLRRRGYTHKKIEENIQAEIFQVCLLEAQERGHKVVVFDVCQMPVSRIISQVMTALRAK